MGYGQPNLCVWIGAKGTDQWNGGWVTQMVERDNCRIPQFCRGIAPEQRFDYQIGFICVEGF